MIILDIQLPDGNGIQLCRQIRENYMMPILFLTCRQDEERIVEGLNAGGDDYVCKPFGMKELYAGMEALLRRVPHFHDVIHVGDLMIDVKSYQVFKQGQLLDLGLIPYYILIHLIEHQGIVVTRQQLLMMIESQTGHDLEDNTLFVHMKRLEHIMVHILKRLEGLVIDGYKSKSIFIKDDDTLFCFSFSITDH